MPLGGFIHGNPAVLGSLEATLTKESVILLEVSSNVPYHPRAKDTGQMMARQENLGNNLICGFHVDRVDVRRNHEQREQKKKVAHVCSTLLPSQSCNCKRVLCHDDRAGKRVWSEVNRLLARKRQTVSLSVSLSASKSSNCGCQLSCPFP